MVSTLIEGKNALKEQDGCEMLYYKSVEVKLPSDSWKSLWSEQTSTSGIVGYSSYLWYSQGETYGYINVAITQETFRKTIMVEHKETEPEVTMELRMVYYTTDGVLLEDLSSYVELIINNQHQDTECSEANVVFVD